MTAAQKALYWREWSACRAALAAAGRPATDTDRHKLQYRALGFSKSSSALTNAEFDKVLAIFRAQSKPADLDAQLRQIDQPDVRRLKLRSDCFDAVVWIQGNDRAHTEDKQSRYLSGISRRVCGVEFHDADERSLQKILGVVRARQRALDRSAAKAREAAGNTDPF